MGQLVDLLGWCHELDPWQEKFIKRCRAISEQVTEETSKVEGEWLTVADMKDLKFSENFDLD